MDSDKEPEKANENVKQIKKYILELMIDPRTLIQLDATLIVGVLFFFTLTALVQSAELHEGVILHFVFTGAAILPFVVSAIFLINADSAQLPFERARSHEDNGSPYDMTKESHKHLLTSYKAIRRARVSTLSGFIYLGIALLFVIITAYLGETKISTAEECAQRPEDFGINTTSPWKCSMFVDGSLAEMCANNHEQFNMSKKACSGFIPDQVSTIPILATT
jgi:hypothetical protein